MFAGVTTDIQKEDNLSEGEEVINYDKETKPEEKLKISVEEQIQEKYSKENILEDSDKESQLSEQQSADLQTNRIKRVIYDPNQPNFSGRDDQPDYAHLINLNSPDIIDSDDEREKNAELFFAIKNNNLQKLQELQKAGVKNNIVDKNNKDNTPLHYAIERDKKEIAEKLLQEWKVDINATNNKGDTPLHIATFKSNKDLVQLLLSRDAKTDIKNCEDRTPLNIANILGRQDIVQIFGSHIQPELQVSSQSSFRQRRTRTNFDEDKSEESALKKAKTISSEDRKMGVNKDEGDVRGKKSKQTSDVQENRKPTGLLTSHHGVVYQAQWIMVVALEAQERLKRQKNSAFRFNTFKMIDFKTEDPDAGKFDDLVWRYETNQANSYEYNFLQAKNKLNREEKITQQDLLKPKHNEEPKQKKRNEKDKRPFALEKYFLSYRDEIKKKYKGNINKLIIATNIDLDDNLKSSFEPLTENIPILDFMKNKVPENWRFKKGDLPIKNELIRLFLSKYDSINLIEQLLQCILKNKHVTDKSPLDSYFYDLIKNEIIDITGKFHPNFIEDNGLSNKAKMFREYVFEIGFKSEKENSCSDFMLSDPNGIAEIIVIQIKANTKEVKITRQGTKQEKTINDNIDKLANYVLVEDDQSKVRFGRVFWENTKLPGNLNEFKQVLTTKLKKAELVQENDNGSQIYEKLSKYHFTITGLNSDTKKAFKTCKEMLISEKAFWEAIHKFNTFNLSAFELEMMTLAKDQSSLKSENIILKTKKFNDNFKNGTSDLSDRAKRFRIFLLKEGYENRRENIKNDFKLQNPVEIAKVIALKIKDSTENKVKIQRNNIKGIDKAKDIIENNIDKLANYVFIKNEEIEFSNIFWEKDELPDTSLIQFRDTLKKKLKSYNFISEQDEGPDIINKLKKYKFTITGKNKDTQKEFTTCKEGLISEETFWKDMENGCIEKNINEILPCNKSFPEKSLSDIKNEIEDFFDRLTFVVNYTQETLNQFIKNKCSWYAGFDTEYIAYEFQVKIANALNLETKEFISTAKEVDSFFKEAQTKLNGLILIGLTLEFKAKVKEYGIEFKDKCIQEIFNFEDSNKQSCDFFKSDKKVFDIVAKHNTLLPAIKVYQAIKDKKHCSYIFMKLSSILRVQDHVIKAFESNKSNNLLIIVCKSTKEEKDIQELYSYLYNILRSENNKKIVLITQEGNILSDKFKRNVCQYSTKDQQQDNVYKKKTEHTIFNDLTESSQQKVLDKRKVIFQGKYVCLSTLVSGDSKRLIGADILFKLFNNEVIEIGKTLTDSKYENVKGYFIDRTFKRYVEIDKKIEKAKSKDNKSKFCVFSDKQIIQPNPHSDEDIKKCKDIILISDKDEIFEELCNQYEQHRIHWLRKGDKFMWQQSRGDLTELRQFVDTRMDTLYTPNKITDIPDRVVIIAAEPGMGKSTALTHLALRTKPSLWIVRINLLDCSTELKIEKQKKIKFNTLTAIKFLYRVVGFHLFKKQNKETAEEKGKREQMIEDFLSFITIEDNKINWGSYGENIDGLSLFEIGLFNDFYNLGRIALLFDGLDEISPDYKDKVIELLQAIKNTKAAKIWVTTRPYGIINKLEDKLNIFSYNLTHLSSPDQSSLLEKFWIKSYKLSNIDNDRVSIFTNELINKFSEFAKGQEREFLSIPLHTWMTARIFQDTFMEFYDSGEWMLSEEHKEKINEMDLDTLFKRFVDIKFFEISLEEKHPDTYRDIDKPVINRQVENDYKRYIENHGMLAVYAIFKEDEVSKLFPAKEIRNLRILTKNINPGKVSTGIIERVVNNKPRFIHRTFAEYFAVNFVSDGLKPHYVKRKWDFLIKIILNRDYNNVRRFFESKLANDHELANLSAKKSNRKKILDLLLEKVDVYSFVNPLSAAAKEGLLKTVEFLLKSAESDRERLFKIINTSNGSRNASPLCLAIENGHSKVVDILLKYLQDLHRIIEIINTGGEDGSLLCLAIKNGHSDVVDTLIKLIKDLDHRRLLEIINYDDEMNGLPLYVALESGHYEIIDILLKYINNSDIVEVINCTGKSDSTVLFRAIENYWLDDRCHVLLHYMEKLDAEQRETLLYTVHYDEDYDPRHCPFTHTPLSKAAEVAGGQLYFIDPQYVNLKNLDPKNSYDDEFPHEQDFPEEYLHSPGLSSEHGDEYISDELESGI